MQNKSKIWKTDFNWRIVINLFIKQVGQNGPCNSYVLRLGCNLWYCIQFNLLEMFRSSSVNFGTNCLDFLKYHKNRKIFSNMFVERKHYQTYK